MHGYHFHPALSSLVPSRLIEAVLILSPDLQTITVTKYSKPPKSNFSFDGDGEVRSTCHCSVRGGYLPLRVVLQMLT